LFLGVTNSDGSFLALGGAARRALKQAAENCFAKGKRVRMKKPGGATKSQWLV
jgi:hypothetical protein